jgi:hypothetical protein
MTRAVLKSVAGVMALLFGTGVMAPGSAQAQSPCYQLFLGEYLPTYGECDEGANGVSAVGQNVSAIGEGFVQLQLNSLAGIGTFATPTGRLRHTEHDGLVETTTNTRTNGFDVDEGSVFGNASYDLPGTYFGGHVRINGLAGYDRLSLDIDGGGNSKTDIDSFIYGGSYLWSKGAFYSMSLIIGVAGNADARTAGGTVAGSAGRYSYDLSGYFTNSVIGYTFDLQGPWKFDLRGGLGHYDIETDRFSFANNAGTIKGVSEAWNASLTGTIFTTMEMNGGTMRPYFLASYKNVFDEDIDIKGTATASFAQATDFGKVELGFDYVQGMVTYGAAGYTEFSSDESTIGARLGVSVKLQ